MACVGEGWRQAIMSDCLVLVRLLRLLLQARSPLLPPLLLLPLPQAAAAALGNLIPPPGMPAAAAPLSVAAAA